MVRHYSVVTFDKYLALLNLGNVLIVTSQHVQSSVAFCTFFVYLTLAREALEA